MKMLWQKKLELDTETKELKDEISKKNASDQIPSY